MNFLAKSSYPKKQELFFSEKIRLSNNYLELVTDFVRGLSSEELGALLSSGKFSASELELLIKQMLEHEVNDYTLRSIFKHIAHDGGTQISDFDNVISAIRKKVPPEVFYSSFLAGITKHHHFNSKELNILNHLFEHESDNFVLDIWNNFSTSSAISRHPYYHEWLSKLTTRFAGDRRWAQFITNLLAKSGKYAVTSEIIDVMLQDPKNQSLIMKDFRENLVSCSNSDEKLKGWFNFIAASPGGTERLVDLEEELRGSQRHWIIRDEINKSIVKSDPNVFNKIRGATRFCAGQVLFLFNK